MGCFGATVSDNFGTRFRFTTARPRDATRGNARSQLRRRWRANKRNDNLQAALDSQHYAAVFFLYVGLSVSLKASFIIFAFVKSID
jgi:hypothetical protein